jgi:hypothetical protein
MFSDTVIVMIWAGAYVPSPSGTQMPMNARRNIDDRGKLVLGRRAESGLALNTAVAVRAGRSADVPLMLSAPGLTCDRRQRSGRGTCR